MNRLVVAGCLGLVISLVTYGLRVEGDTMTIEDGRKIAFNYTLKVEGEIIDSSDNRGPFMYTHGKGEIIPGLSTQLEGLHIGDERVIEVPSEGAYGQIDPEAFRELPKTSLPADLEPKVGMMLQAQSPNGAALPARITEVKDSSVKVDLNHPLAGKTLTFEVKIVSIE